MCPRVNMTSTSIPPILKRLLSAKSRSHCEPSAGKAGKVVKTLPKPLHLDHLFADGGRRARLVLEVTRRREVVGMRMRIEDPLEPVALLLDVGEQRVGRVRRGVPDLESKSRQADETRKAPHCHVGCDAYHEECEKRFQIAAPKRSRVPKPHVSTSAIPTPKRRPPRIAPPHSRGGPT